MTNFHFRNEFTLFFFNGFTRRQQINSSFFFAFHLGDMDEGIYRMSLVESLLVLVVIALWLLAIISLAKKLERICNPPSIFPNYSLHAAKVSVCPSSRRDRRSNDSVQSTLPPPVNWVRATSEPAIDASPRATIYVRSPSETCLHVKSTSTLRMSTMSQHLSSPSNLELGQARRNTHVDCLSVPRNSSYQIRVESSDRHLPTQNLIDPKRIPSIVRRSFLDLHRRTLFSNTPSNISPIRCIVTAAGNPNSIDSRPITTAFSPKMPLLNKHRGANETDDDDWYRGNLIIQLQMFYLAKHPVDMLEEEKTHRHISMPTIRFFFFFSSEKITQVDQQSSSCVVSVGRRRRKKIIDDVVF